jgi:hypothetical protein
MIGIICAYCCSPPNIAALQDILTLAELLSGNLHEVGETK